MVDNPRINELRRRVQADPASIAFAQLAEECRRAGANDEAVTICRNGLARHPGYLSARVTLGRALIELGELDDARHELDIVVLSAPDNMAAIRGLAEICQQQGRLDEALEHYRHALALASHDADLEDTVDRISQAIAPPLQTQPTDVPAVAVEELFDFDKLLAELGEVADHEPEPPAVPLVAQAPLQVPEVLRPTGGTDLRPDDVDEFAAMERELRAFEDQRAKDEQAARELRALEAARQREADEQLVRELEEARLKSLEEDRLHALELQRLEELEVQRLRELEDQQLRELEAARQREDDEQLVRELEEARLKSLEEDRRREAEDTRRMLARRKHEAVLNGLESWLGAIVADRDHHSSL